MVSSVKAALEHLLSLSLVPNVGVYLCDNIRAAHESFKRYIDQYYNADLQLSSLKQCVLMKRYYLHLIHEREQTEARVNQERVVSNTITSSRSGGTF